MTVIASGFPDAPKRKPAFGLGEKIIDERADKDKRENKEQKNE